VLRLDDEAAEHLCRVAAGLDSLVLGEAQIQGQVISTYTAALEAGTIGPVLSTLFRTAIRVGKRARTETQISTRAVSMSSVALSMAARHFPDFSQTRVLVIGAGEMSRLALKALLQRQVTNVTVANRTLARAEAVLMHPQWQAISLDELTKTLHSYDVIFSATSAVGFVVTREQFLQSRRLNGKPHDQVLIDLAVPRDIDPTLREVPNVILVDVDDLRQGLDQSLGTRKQALPAVYAIIDEEMARWQAQQRELSMRPFVVELRQRAERIRQQEVERTMRFIGTVDDETRQHIQHLSRALVNKILHEPTIRIKELAHNHEADAYVSAICDIFGLEAEPDPGPVQNVNIEDAKVNGEASRR
jgi:glutamyl-tRNA reductase